MKKIILLIAVLCVFCVGALHAQTPVKGLTVTGAYDTMKTVEPTPRFVSKTGELYKHPVVSVTGQVLTTLDRNSCTVTNAHTNTTDYTGSSTTPGNGGLETLKEGSTNQIITVTDQEGNVYPVVQIGGQCWMKENLRTTHYANGTSIALGSSPSTTTAYCYYPENNSSNVSTYGYLYNWKAVMGSSSSSSANPSGVQGICPTGWHVPSVAEWTQLTDYVGSQTQYQCDNSSENIAKALASTTGWNSFSETCAVGNNPGTNNATGFSALPVGYYDNGYYGSFGDDAYFYSATEYNDSYAYGRYLSNDDANVRGIISDKLSGFSVRCVRDIALNLSSTAINNKVYIGATPVSVTYTATPENGTDGYTFTWENESGIVAADGNSYTTTYSTLGVHTVTCTATGYGISLSKTITIDVLSVDDEND